MNSHWEEAQRNEVESQVDVLTTWQTGRLTSVTWTQKYEKNEKYWVVGYVSHQLLKIKRKEHYWIFACQLDSVYPASHVFLVGYLPLRCLLSHFCLNLKLFLSCI